jgi:FMN phosphatase YigB (HAD superfamily)
LKEEEGRLDIGDLFKAFGQLDTYYEAIENELWKKDFIKKDVIEKIKKITERKGIAANSMKRTILLWMKIYSLGNLFDFIFTGDDSKYTKSSVLYWKDLMRKEDIISKECMIIGNNKKEDADIPSTLGFKCILINDFLKLS